MNEVLKKEQKEEAIKRMKDLGILSQTIKEFLKEDVVNKSEYGGILIWLDEDEKEVVREFEEEYNALVFHAIKNSYKMTDGSVMSCFDLLYVSSHKEEWQAEEEDLKDGLVMAYTINSSWDVKEFGYIQIAAMYGGLTRVA